MKCRVKEFDYLLASIVGSGIVAAGGLAHVTYIILKKKIASMALQRSIIPEQSNAMI